MRLELHAFSFCVISLRLKQTNKKQKTKKLCLIQFGNQNVYDTLDTNTCSSNEWIN